MSPERPECPTPSQKTVGKTVGTQTPKNMENRAEGSPGSPPARRSLLPSLEDGHAQLTPAYAYRQRTASSGSGADFATPQPHRNATYRPSQENVEGNGLVPTVGEIDGFYNFETPNRPARRRRGGRGRGLNKKMGQLPRVF